jgi:UDP-2,3-diacylglucosamine pyrophosphatase LpxH
MSSPERPIVVERLPADRTIWFISDLHLGDGTPCDVFFGKDRPLKALVERVEREGATLVIVGDAMDFHQAWTFTRILRAHQELLDAMSRLGRAERLIYVVGNHDYDISLYRQLLHFRVCDELHVGDQILVQHGYQYDPFIGNHSLDGSHLATKLHHAVERYLNTWVRVPLGEFYTRTNRFAVWFAHKVGMTFLVGRRALERVGIRGGFERVRRALDHWARSNLGDSMAIFRPARQQLRESTWPFLLCGHSHVPGLVRENGKTYVNTGSWTFAASQYVVWDGRDCSVHDWMTGRSYGDELYQWMMDGSQDDNDFFHWWDQNYLGWFRFREGEERRGRLHTWEAFARDQALLAEWDGMS